MVRKHKRLLAKGGTGESKVESKKKGGGNETDDKKKKKKGKYLDNQWKLFQEFLAQQNDGSDSDGSVTESDDKRKAKTTKTPKKRNRHEKSEEKVSHKNKKQTYTTKLYVPVVGASIKKSAYGPLSISVVH